jgi:hypothetical protein
VNWFQDSLLKAHVMFASPDWVADRGGRFDPERLTALLASAGVTALELYCKDIHGYAYYPTRFGIGEPYPRDVLGELLSACRAAGIKFIAYHSIGWDRLAGDTHQDWQMRNADGSIPFAEVQDRLRLPWVCINTGYRAFALGRIDELLERYDVDGFFIDIFMDNIPSVCYCAACQAGFETAYGQPIPEDLADPAAVARIREFQAASYLAVLQEIRSIIARRRPAALLTYNFVGGITADSTTFSDLVDWHEVEAHAPDFNQQSRTANLLRARGKPFEIMSPGCAKSLREGGDDTLEIMGDWMSMSPKPLVASRTEAAIALAHGGTLTLSVNPRPDGSLNEAEVESFLALGAWIRERLLLFGPSSPISDVGVLWTEASYKAASLEIGARVELLSGDLSVQGLHRALAGDHAQFDIVRAQVADLDAYQLVILPETIAVDEETERRLREYVEHGGHLLVIGGAPAPGVATADQPEARLADVIGVAPASPAADETFYVRIDDPELSRNLPAIPLMMRGTAVGCRLTTAVAMARFVPQLAPRTRTEYVWPTAYNPPGEETDLPVITMNRYGAGACTYVAFPLAVNAARRATLDPTPRLLLANLVRRATARPFLRTNAPLLVEAIANRTPDGGVIVHLVNWYTGVEGNYSLEGALPGIADVYLELDASRLRASSAVVDGSGAALQARLDADTGYLRIEVPVLRDHLAVRIIPTT